MPLFKNIPLRVDPKTPFFPPLLLVPHIDLCALDFMRVAAYLDSNIGNDWNSLSLGTRHSDWIDTCLISLNYYATAHNRL